MDAKSYSENIDDDLHSRPDHLDSVSNSEPDEFLNSLKSLRALTEESVVRSRMVGVLETCHPAHFLLSLSLDELRSLVDFDHASVALCDESGENLQIYEIAGNIHDEIVQMSPFTGSQTEQALKQMEAIMLPDDRVPIEVTPLQQEDELHQTSFRSGILCPLYSNGRPIGSLTLWSLEPEAYMSDDLSLLERMVSPFAEAIENTILKRGSSQCAADFGAEITHLQVINDLCLTLQKVSCPQQAIDLAVKFLGELLSVDRCRALLFSDKVYAEYIGEWIADGVPPVSDSRELHKRNPIPELIRTDGKPIILSDVANAPISKGLEDLVAKNQLKSIIYVPIVHHGAVIGTLTVHQTRYQRNWVKEDVVLLVAAATQIGTALENIRLITRLKEANRLKDEFLNNLSHELRTPLNGITGYLELLSTHSVVESNPELAEGFDAMSYSSRILIRLISDLLDMSRIQKNELTLDRVRTDINLTIKSAVQSLKQSVLAQQLDLQIELTEHLPALWVDDRRIQKVIWNLLSNAIKFTPPGGSIKVRSTLSEIPPEQERPSQLDESKKWIVIEVEDSGEGIPKEFLPFIWERFRQADGSITRKHGGLGIGLSLVKAFIKAHDGKVEAKNRTGCGAIFKVWLPLP